MLRRKLGGKEMSSCLENASSKLIYKMLIQKKLCQESVGKKKYNAEYNIDNRAWKKIYTLYESYGKTNKC